MKKICTKCKQLKDIGDFYKQRKAKDGHWYLLSWCKKCDNVRRNKYTFSTSVNKEKRKIYNQRLDVKMRKRNNERERIKRPEVRLYLRNYYRNVRGKNLSYRLNSSMRGMLWSSLRHNKNGRKWEFLVGYTLVELKTHLEVLFTEGMNWNNYGLWHIDHIKPKSSFKFSSPNDIEFKKCWALSNLQPLWAEENMRKHDKILGNSVLESRLTA